MATPTTLDWGLMVEQLLAHGVTRSQVHAGLMSDRIVAHYAKGVEPLHWRGERILSLWCKTLGKSRDEAPTRPVVFGHRAERGSKDRSPKALNLPAWPPLPGSRC